MNRTEIAARVGAAQYDLANGRNQLQVEKDLIELRKEIAADLEGAEEKPEVIDGYRADAVAQLARVREMLGEMDLPTIPDMELFMMSAGCELARQKIHKYFGLRNLRAAEHMQEA